CYYLRSGGHVPPSGVAQMGGAVSEKSEKRNDRRGVSRRDLIKGAAAAGVVAWTAPIIIDSLSSPAAAASGAAGAGLPCSWAYVFFKKPNDATVYFTGFSNGLTACGTGSSNNTNPNPACWTANGVTYSIANFSGGDIGSVGSL